MQFTQDNLREFFNDQLKKWPEARHNYKILESIKRKSFSLGDLKGFVQCNPKRAVSTNAKIDSKTIAERRCFLCKSNRPSIQDSLKVTDKWELLVNPFPILSPHFTISSVQHIPQELMLEEGLQLAHSLPGTVIFYNDPGAGASAPDHQHFQAVSVDELPLIKLINSNPLNREQNLPYKFYLFTEGEVKSSDLKFNFPVNAFFWLNNKGFCNIGLIPRKAHRPQCFFKEPPERRAVSPGAIDMAGIIVTPYEEDFNLISDSDIEEIYLQTAFSSTESQNIN